MSRESLPNQPQPAPVRAPLSFGSLALVLLALACTILITKRATAEKGSIGLLTDHGLVAGSDTAPAQAPAAGRAIGTTRVKDLRGNVIPLITKGEPAIVMISSRTCSWCKKALKDIGDLSEGRPVTRLKLITLEGAAEGVDMVGLGKITGAQLLGPATDADKVLLTFRYPGTPTLVAVDKNGRVVRTIPGYPIRDEMQHWVTVMLGEQDAP